MDTQYQHNAPKVVTLPELERRREEFDVPEGALEALRAGSAPVIVFLRADGEPYNLVNPQETIPARTTEGVTDSLDNQQGS